MNTGQSRIFALPVGHHILKTVQKIISPSAVTFLPKTASNKIKTMKKLLLLQVLLFTLWASAQPDLKSRFDSLTKSYEQNGYHGVILVASKDKVLYESGYGYAHFEQKIKHTPENNFQNRIRRKNVHGYCCSTAGGAEKAEPCTNVKRVVAGTQCPEQ